MPLYAGIDTTNSTILDTTTTRANTFIPMIDQVVDTPSIQNDFSFFLPTNQAQVWIPPFGGTNFGLVYQFRSTVQPFTASITFVGAGGADTVQISITESTSKGWFFCEEDVTQIITAFSAVQDGFHDYFLNGSPNSSKAPIDGFGGGGGGSLVPKDLINAIIDNNDLNFVGGMPRRFVGPIKTP